MLHLIWLPSTNGTRAQFSEPVTVASKISQKRYYGAEENVPITHPIEHLQPLIRTLAAIVAALSFLRE